MSQQPNVKRITCYPPSYCILNLLSTKGGALIIFRIRVNSVLKTDEVKLSLPPYGQLTPQAPVGVILRYNSGSFNYQWYDNSGSFQQLSSSDIRPDGIWHTITLSLTPQSVTLLENGNYKFTWNVNVPDKINPTFDMQILNKGGSLDIDIGDVYAIPSNVNDNTDD
ncbi:LamG domain-containing protein [Rhizophagus clarus]|uniref:LamG domain-containing protein n=1 Tax=Rhizophagus clarus TaxID=94130 RepID=A0A8H3LCM3_9GLOM|nr:LamG domain-containing protein [Rhizophagus clarus]